MSRLDLETMLEANDHDSAQTNLTVRAIRQELADLYRQVQGGGVPLDAAKVRLAILSALSNINSPAHITGGIHNIEAASSEPLNLRGGPIGPPAT